MNSFNTHEETVKTLKKYSACNINIHTFNQSCHPRIGTESLLPVANTFDKNPKWYVQYPVNFLQPQYLGLVKSLLSVNPGLTQ